MTRPHSTSKPTVGLCMIVKNERDVIERCMTKVAPIIDTWTIVDTGSSDETQEIIRSTAKSLGIEGRLHQRPWVNFGHNRTEAIQLAREHSDYLFFIDADEILELPDGYKLPHLDKDAYAVTMASGDLRYSRTCLASTKLPLKYTGVMHEYLDPGKPIDPELLNGVFVWFTSEGARSKNPRKYHDDARVLEEGLKQEPDNLRYWYYLAQCWREAGEIDKAIQTYQHRAALRGWAEEDWHAMYQVARLMDRAGYPDGSVINAYLKAFDYRPSRAEPLVWLACYLRHKNRWPSAKAILLEAVKIPVSKDRLFVEIDCYGWRRSDEFALALYHLGDKTNAQKLWESLLKPGQLPSDQTDRIKKNLGFC
ncbi:MAG: glycosyltransferase [Pseudomonadota bacterium]